MIDEINYSKKENNTLLDNYTKNIMSLRNQYSIGIKTMLDKCLKQTQQPPITV